MKRILTLAIVISLFLPPTSLFAKERRGANIEITKSDGTKIKGELIGVKQDSTLILESYSITGGSVDLSEVKSIKIVKQSNIGLGVRLGLIIGGGGGALLGVHFSGGYGAIVGGLYGGLSGLVIGAIIGAPGADETIDIFGGSPCVMATILEKLRSKARFPDYQ